MARIKDKTQYPLDQLISVDDYLLGTDSDSLFATKSYSIGDLTDFVVSYITQLPEVSYESISESGLKAAGNITTIIGDYDDSGFETKVTISDSAKTIVLNADTYIRTSSDIQIGGATDFFTVLTSAGLTATRTLQSPDAGGYIGLSVNGVKADSAGDMAVSAASLIASGIVELATIAETDTGTDATRAMTPAGLKGSALQTKVDGIEALADVTDATNVNAAGATMNADTTLAGYGYFLDEDDMTSDDDTKTVSQQSVKKFVEDSTQLGQLYATVVKTANYTVTANDYSVICTTNSFTVSLPAAATAGLGKRYEVVNTGTNTEIIVDPDGAETLDGLTTQTLSSQYQSMIIECDGTEWFTVSDSRKGLFLPTVGKSGTYTATVYDYLIIATANSFTITLPVAAVAGNGKRYEFKNVGTGTITIDGDGTETIDGQLTQLLTAQYESITVACDGSNWHIVG
jgi:hypothetical protein